MSYYGWVTQKFLNDDALVRKAFEFLKEAFPNFAYKNSFKGDITRFEGKEVSYKGEPLHIVIYFGGLIL